MWVYFIIWFLVAALIYLRKQHDYWRLRGVHTPKYQLLFGNLWEQFILRKNFGLIITDAYNKFENYNYFGFYNATRPTIIVRNPELIGDILVKDFAHFADNDFEVDPHVDPIMGRNPFILKGNEWREVRHQITPSFTTHKVKGMLPLLMENAGKLRNYLEIQGNVPLDTKLLSMRITSENVASCAFGLNDGSFDQTRPQGGKFLEISQQLFNPSLFNIAKAFFIFLIPPIARLIRTRFFLRETVDFLRSVLVQTLDYRKRNKVQRHDFLDAMLELQGLVNQKGKKEVLTFDDILAHAGGFFLNGIETSSVVLSHALYELASNLQVQQTLRAEIKLKLGYNSNMADLTYDTIQEMEYLDWVFKENLRRNPPLFFMTKRVTKPYTLGNMQAIAGVENCIRTQLETGTPVIIPIYALHHDANHFPNENEFLPERFSPEQCSHIKRFTYLPFSEGPRMCLGRKFGILQLKIALIAIISKFHIRVHSKTQQPIVIDPMNFVNTPKNGFWLQFTPESHSHNV